MNNSDMNGMDMQNGDMHTHEDIRGATGSITLTPEVFEKVYLAPWKQARGGLRETFGNPTPLGVGGFILALAPLSNILLDFRGSGGLGASQIGAFFFFGGLLMIIAGVLEFVLGNTFPSIVFFMFGAFWFTWASTFQNFYNAISFFDPGAPESKAILTPEFLDSFAFFWIYMAVLSFIFMIGALRTNVVFYLIFLLLIPFFSCLAEAFFRFGEGNVASGTHFQHSAGGLGFAISIIGFYLFLHLILAVVDFPIQLPVGDLSGHIKGKSEREQAKENGMKNDEESGGLKKKFMRKK